MSADTLETKNCRGGSLRNQTLLDAKPRVIAASCGPSEISNPIFSQVETYSITDSAGSYFRFRNVFDRVVGSILLVIASPLIAVLWCTVKLTSSGPGFYIQRRVGLDGVVFDIFKLRSMRCDAERGGKAIWSFGLDRRVTPIGRILRKLHLDELPQLWNVARGDMALVGPRPERPEITWSLEKLVPNYHLRHSVKPGVTGLSQINLEPDRNINITRKKQILDLRYIQNANAWLDARMLFATMLRMVGINGELVMRITSLKQFISCDELSAIGYQFDASDDELWDPSKGSLNTAESLSALRLFEKSIRRL